MISGARLMMSTICSMGAASVGVIGIISTRPSGYTVRNPMGETVTPVPPPPPKFLRPFVCWGRSSPPEANPMETLEIGITVMPLSRRIWSPTMVSVSRMVRTSCIALLMISLMELSFSMIEKSFRFLDIVRNRGFCFFAIHRG